MPEPMTRRIENFEFEVEVEALAKLDIEQALPIPRLQPALTTLLSLGCWYASSEFLAYYYVKHLWHLLAMISRSHPGGGIRCSYGIGVSQVI